jgi:hypothetical protein
MMNSRWTSWPWGEIPSLAQLDKVTANATVATRPTSLRTAGRLERIVPISSR